MNSNLQQKKQLQNEYSTPNVKLDNRSSLQGSYSSMEGTQIQDQRDYNGIASKKQQYQYMVDEKDEYYDNSKKKAMENLKRQQATDSPYSRKQKAQVIQLQKSPKKHLDGS